MKISRIYRLLELITMIESGRGYTVSELAEELQVSRRTIFRDLNVLAMARIPYYFDKEKRTYRIDRHFFLPPINLTLSESLAMLLFARRSSSSGMEPLSSAGARGAMKLESVLPESIRDYVGTIVDHVAILPSPTARQNNLEDVFERLATAISEQKVCKIVYISFYERRQIVVVVEPLRLAFVSRAWYLIAYSRKHRQQRTFKLSRIRKLTVLQEKFEPSARKDSATNGFGDAWCMIPEGKYYDIHLHFTAMVAGNVAEVKWHRTQQVEWNDDGSIEFRARVDGLGEIIWWILGYGDQVRVISPAVLAKRVAGVAKRMAKLYSTKSRR